MNKQTHFLVPFILIKLDRCFSQESEMKDGGLNGKKLEIFEKNLILKKFSFWKIKM